MRIDGVEQKVSFAFSFLVLLKEMRARGQSKISSSGLKINVIYRSVNMSDAVQIWSDICLTQAFETDLPKSKLFLFSKFICLTK